ncbi:hypothetical protein B0H14DRAFT_2761705 [Mycena olivaceomarginata]|nr:hypothetical protein B0H14DRAFT_2761705 [Mycena olivaceomarginata]
MPSSVKIKYLAATSVVQNSVVQKSGFTWAGQTFSGIFESDRWPMGQEDVKMVQCDTTHSPRGIASRFSFLWLGTS